MLFRGYMDSQEYLLGFSICVFGKGPNKKTTSVCDGDFCKVAADAALHRYAAAATLDSDFRKKIPRARNHARNPTQAAHVYLASIAL